MPNETDKIQTNIHQLEESKASGAIPVSVADDSIAALKAQLATYNAEFNGDGAIAQGPNSIALGKNATLINGNYYNTTNINASSHLDANTPRGLRMLLNKVKTYWIKEILEDSVYSANLVNLGKELQSNAVEHPLDRILELPEAANQTLSPNDKMIDIFDQKGSLLLILGEPGSGKTITLLELARDLVVRAEKDQEFIQPIPVVFNLSTWSRQPFIDWMAQELAEKYQIGKRFGRDWVEHGYLLPLLDGLDEVTVGNQAACVESINEFCAAFGVPGLVVSCRFEEYTRLLPVRLKLNAAVRLQPFTLQQIDDYLAAAGSKLGVLRAILPGDTSLQSLAQSPLILNVMSFAYQDITADALASQTASTLDERRRHLFDAYIERVFRRKGHRKQPYTREQTMKWLACLAYTMTEHRASIFLIEGLQPSWLPNRTSRWAYTFASRIISGLTLGLFFGLFLWPIFGWLFVVSGGLMGLSIGLVHILQSERKGPHLTPKVNAFNVFGVGLLGGLIGVSVIELLLQASSEWITSWMMLFGPMAGMMFSILWLQGRGRQSLNEIRTVEILTWSWRNARDGAMDALMFGWDWIKRSRFVVGVANGALFALILGLMFVFMPIGVLLGALFGGMKSGIVESKKKANPNQGIRLSLRNAITAGLINGLIVGLPGLISGLIYSLSAGLETGLGIALKFGLVPAIWFGLLTAMWFGGLDIIHHYILRINLWYADCMPWNCSRFLDYACESILLHRVGGGYIFIHRLLMEHFASMNKIKGIYATGFTVQDYDTQKAEIPSQLVSKPTLTSVKLLIAASNKSPVVAGLLSFFLLGGAGHIYLGQRKKGIALMATTILVPVIGILIGIIGVSDAYVTAKKLNTGNPVTEWEFNINWKVVGLVIIIYAIAIIGGLVFLASLSPSG